MEIYHDISRYSDSELDVVNCIINGRNDINVKNAINFFQDAFKKSKELTGSPEIFCSLQLESLFELATIEYDVKRRYLLWDRLLKTALLFLNKYPQHKEIVIHCTNIVISYIQEPFLYKEYLQIKHGLTVLIGKIDSLIKSKGVLNCAELLTAKSRVLRCLSNYQTNSELEKITNEKAIRCIEKSLDIDDTIWYSHLELGKCHWRSSVFEKQIGLYNKKISLAELAYKKSQEIETTIQNTLALCQLYKETHQTAPFLLAFNKYEKVERNKRRYLQNSFLLAENVVTMYYSGFPSVLLDEYISKSDKILNEALLAGYHDARIITNLSFLKAAKGDIGAGSYILNSLNAKGVFDWNTIVADLDFIKSSDDLFAQGFVLGIDDSNTWNKLGTFAIDFLENVDIGLNMYDIALALNPSNPIISTNIARTLLKTNIDESVLQKAEYFISRAESASSFRFQWWRQVRLNIKSAKQELREAEPSKEGKKNYNLRKIGDLYKLYLNLKEKENHQERGFDFEKLIDAYFRVSLGNSIPSHKIISATTEQIDAAFYFEKDYYRVEAKWTKSKSDHTDIGDFYFKLKTQGVTGLMISVNGFTESAVARARSLKETTKIILMDGDELEMTLNGSPPFDEAIRLKQLYFYLEDNPYHKINSVNKKDNLFFS